MSATPQQSSTWAEILGFLKDNSIAGGLFLLLWQAIQKLSNHFSEKHKTELREMAKTECSVLETKLTAKVETLEKEVHALREMLYNRRS